MPSQPENIHHTMQNNEVPMTPSVEMPENPNSTPPFSAFNSTSDPTSQHQTAQHQTAQHQATQQAVVNPYYLPINNNNYNPYIQNDAMHYSPPSLPIEKKSSASSDFVKGALIGAAVTYLLTNNNVQNALFKTVAKTSHLFQMGMEEVKERFEDAKAEVAAKNLNE
jgi:hypothetical protein